MKEREGMDHVINKKADISAVLATYMKKKKIKTTELANQLGYTQPWISKLRSGKIKLDFNQVSNLLDSLPEDSDELQLVIAHQLFPVIPPLADGRLTFDQDALHLGLRSISELQEATRALVNSTDEFNDGRDADQHDPIEAAKQLLDAVFIGLNTEINICHEYGFSLTQLMRERNALWKKDELVR